MRQRELGGSIGVYATSVWVSGLVREVKAWGQRHGLSSSSWDMGSMT